MSLPRRYTRPGRLEDVILLLQVLGTYRHYKQSSDIWATKVIKSNALSADSWTEIFEEHTEFFRSSKHGVCLAKRRATSYDTDDYRASLSPEELSMLIEAAVMLYRAEREELNARQWWQSPLVVAGLAFASLQVATIVTVVLGQ